VSQAIESTYNIWYNFQMAFIENPLSGGAVRGESPGNPLGANRAAPLTGVGTEARSPIRSQGNVVGEAGTAAATPIRLRGHHLDYVDDLVHGETPHDIATSATNAMVQMRGDITDEEAQRRLNKPYFQRRDDVEYAVDTVGVTPQHAESYSTAFKAVLTELVDSPDDASVKLVDAQRDGICEAAICGRHCAPSITQDFSRSGPTDGIYIQAFKTVAEDLGLAGEIVEGTEEVVYGPNITRDTQTLTVPSGVVRRVVQDNAFGDTLNRLLAEAGGIKL
jgi:hypothetical protein